MRIGRFLLLLLGVNTYSGEALPKGGKDSFDLDANFRTIAAGLDSFDFEPSFNPGNDADFLSVSVLRLIAAGQPSERLTYEAHAVSSFSYFTLGPGASAPGLGRTGTGIRYRALDADWDWLEDDDLSGNLLFDRFNLKLAFSQADVTLGRQAVTFGTAYFWNPLDVFSPFDPRQFDRDYKAGVDALRIDVPLGKFSGLNSVAALGREMDASGKFVGGEQPFHSSSHGSAVLARAFTNLKGWDFTVQGGKVYGGYQVGAAAVGEIGPVELRLETAYLLAQDGPPLPFGLPGRIVEDHFQGVIGLGRRFESSLALEAEYFFNGAGEADDLDAALIRFNTGGSLDLSRQLLGFMARYEILPILTGQVASMVSLSDGSSQLQPSLKVSVANEIDLLVGLIVNFGERPAGFTPFRPDLRSEFGSQPNVIYAELKIYF